MKKYYNNYIVPFQLLKNNEQLEGISNFSLDFKNSNNKIDNKLKIILSILNKILLRGKKTLLSDFEESNILKYFGYNTDIFEKKGKESKKVINILNYIYRVELGIINALFLGHINFTNKNSFVIDYDFNGINYEEKLLIKDLIISNFGNLIDYLSILYGHDNYFKDINILLKEDLTGYNDNYFYFTNKEDIISSSLNYIYIRENENIPEINNNLFIIDDNVINEYNNIKIDVNKELLEFFLTYIFRKKDFREGQFDSIEGLFNKKDMLVLLPTGNGKSLIFQLYSILTPGTSLIICPLISLIEDQVDNLNNCGIDNIQGIVNNGIKSKNEVLKDLQNNSPILIYVSPEKIQTNEFRDFIDTYKINNFINLLVIDEAHCVSEWGHDFRFSYLNIGNTLREICNTDIQKPHFLALTGTASNSVLKDMQRELNIYNFKDIITPSTFKRKELSFEILKSKSKEKEEVLKNIFNVKLPNFFNDKNFYKLNGDNTNSGVIFCPHASGKYGVENVSNILKDIGIKDIGIYGGKQSEKEKIKITKDFKNNKFSLLIATKGFGMGIDKPNIRYTIHYGLPNSIESFYQESGRSGRDGQNAKNYLILSNDDINRTNKIFNPNTEIKEISNILKIVSGNNSDDIIRSIWFHFQSFKGVSDEKTYVDLILDNVYEDNRKYINIKINNEDKSYIEKAIQRLLLINVISDYTIDFTNKEFLLKKSNKSLNEVKNTYLKYIENYNASKVSIENKKLLFILNKDNISEKEKVKKITYLLIKFIYDTIEKGRRRGIKEVLLLGDKQDEDISIAIIKYLEGYKVEVFDKLINENPIKFDWIKKIIGGYEEDGVSYGGIISPIEAEKINGYSIRYLESYPDNPQLILIKMVSEILMLKSNYKDDSIINEIVLAKNFSINKYGISKGLFNDNLIWFLKKIFDINNDEYDKVIIKLINKLNDFSFVRSIILKDGILPNKMLIFPYTWYFTYTSEKYLDILSNMFGMEEEF